MDLAYGRLSRFAYMDWRLHEHTLAKGIIEGLFVSNELSEVLDLSLCLHVTSYNTLTRSDIMLDGRKHILVSYITRATQIGSLRPRIFARLFIIFDLLHGIFEVNGLCDV